jgi:hypothetical protein
MTSKTSQAPVEANSSFQQFLKDFAPLEALNVMLLVDHKTEARYCECHVRASKILSLGTTDVPLDPDEQAEYRANREIVENAPAYARMIEDAKNRRTFSNIVTEFTTEFDKPHPLKIIGGQHRFEAIRVALSAGIDEYHGVKVYFDLNIDQRLDVQLISNTNIAISGDLFDRMNETVMGPELRNWFQTAGIIDAGQDFADRRQRGGPISVQLARTFILNYFRGTNIDPKKFDITETTPDLCDTGAPDSEWEILRKNTDLWSDEGLVRAGKEFAALVKAQRQAFANEKKKPPDYPEKALNPAILAAWAYISGVLRESEVRLNRHFALAQATGHDPLNVAALVKGRHKSDPDQYRGLGYRTDPKERGRFAELFFLQAENGIGITKSNIDVAVAQYHAKVATLDVEKLRAKASNA